MKLAALLIAAHCGGLAQAQAQTLHLQANAATTPPAAVWRASSYRLVRVGAAVVQPILEPRAGQRVSFAQPEPRNATSWPWLAVGGILGILATLSLASRRHLPFGNKL